MRRTAGADEEGKEGGRPCACLAFSLDMRIDPMVCCGTLRDVPAPPNRSSTGPTVAPMRLLSRTLLALLSLVCAATLGAAWASAAASASGSASAVSVAAHDQPLRSVLAELSRATGYSFRMSAGWDDVPVTASIEKAPLASAVNRILKAVGSTNHAVSIREAEKTVVITMFGVPPKSTARIAPAAAAAGEPPRATGAVEDEDPSDPYLTPPLEPGGRGAKASEVQAVASLEAGGDPAAAPSVPPLFPGGPAITVQELEALMEQAKASEPDPETVEVVPGVTLKEFNQMMAAAGASPEDADPVVLPVVEGQAPVRASDLARAAASQPPSETDIVVPPVREGDPGVTLGEFKRLTEPRP